MGRLLLSVILFQLLFSYAIAQEHIIQGRVFSEEGELALAGVSVKVKGTTQSAQTGIDGRFILKVIDPNSILVFSYVGYDSREIAANNTSISNVVLKAAVGNLNEVIVVAYGSARKESFTGAASVIKSDAFENRPITSFEKALQGAAAGVQVTSVSGQPGASSTVRIRGIGSIHSSSTPLYVIDGVAITAGNLSYMSQNLGVTQTADVLSNLNPNDIESVTVLKDAAATAIYGSRAANGVILINTKQGKNGDTKFSVSSTVGYSSEAVKKFDVLSGEQYYKLFWDTYYAQRLALGSDPAAAALSANTLTNQKLVFNPYNTANPYIADGVLDDNAALNYSTDWRDEVLRTGVTKDINVSARGGSEKINFYVAGGYLDQKGIVIGSDFNRYSGRVNVSNKVNNNFTIGANNTLSYSIQNTPPGASSAANPVRFGDLVSGIYPVYQYNTDGSVVLDANGKKVYNYVNPVNPDFNPLGLAELDEYNTRTARVITNPYAELTFLKSFKARSAVGVDYITNRERQFYNPLHGNGVSPKGRGYRFSREDITITFINTLNYNHSVGEHSFDIIAGQESFKSRRDQMYTQSTNFAFPGEEDLVASSTPTVSTSLTSDRRLASYFSRLNYSFNNKYYLSASFRSDGSTVFGTDNKYGNFYSVGAAWSVKREKFLSSATFIDDLKLKASYGTTGNDKLRPDNGASSSTYSSSNSLNATNDGRFPYQEFYSLGSNYQGLPGMVYAQMENSGLRWEKISITNIGLEFSLFNQKINGEIAYYNRGSSGLLFEKPITLTTGFQTINTNFASMNNYGMELFLNTNPIKTKDFNWNASLNLATNRNKVGYIGQDKITNNTKRLKEGTDIYSWFLKEYAGVDPEDGRPMWYMDEIDANGDLTGERVTTKTWSQGTQYAGFGSALPKVTGGLNNNLRYKQFDLSLYTYFSLGNKIYDGLYSTLMHSGSSIGTQLSTDVYNAWKNPGDQTSVPRFGIGNTDLGNSTSSRFLFDGSYMRVKNIALGYSIGKKLLQPIKVASVRLFIMAENPLTFARHKGMDPEVDITGLTNSDIPNVKTFSMGVNIGL